MLEEVRLDRSLRALVRRPAPLAGARRDGTTNATNIEVVAYLPGAAGRAEHWLWQLRPELLGEDNDNGESEEERPEGKSGQPSVATSSKSTSSASSATPMLGDDRLNWLQIAVDYPGSGDPGSVESTVVLGTRAVGQLMWRLLDRVASVTGIQISSVHLVGLSFGGMVAQHMALQRPSRVASVLLLNTYPGLRHGSIPFPFPLAGILWLIFCALTLCTMGKATSDLNEAWLRWGPPSLRMSHSRWKKAADMLAQASAPTSSLRQINGSCKNHSNPSSNISSSDNNITGNNDTTNINNDTNNNSTKNTKPCPPSCPTSLSWLVRLWLLRRVGDVAFVLGILAHGLSMEEWATLAKMRCLVLASCEDWLVYPDNGHRLSQLLHCRLVEFPRHGHLLQLESP
eukprot:CAMPEP_0206532172 /NCGR_PEP_ID=MMETSP0325_2-20121206/4201_1 /ASSEMBLY_ACC=CAM_ASM_000347 /TAXON_ID=2866 /ORGANISM="Crypthecodinium cohnii, Strain Seligo" /LENGTH=398 /DNA_ID=CAMNT_0054028553 /DNA_START=168 /DNA_END=1361 /DNA_ORIENTATION=-